jgi:hypothetical protein
MTFRLAAPSTEVSRGAAAVISAARCRRSRIAQPYEHRPSQPRWPVPREPQDAITDLKSARGLKTATGEVTGDAVCLLAVRQSEVFGLDGAERETTYYSALLAWVGCTADSHEVAALFGHDVALRATSFDVGAESAADRARAAAKVLVSGGRAVEGALAAHGQVTGQLADGLGLGERVHGCLRQTFAR